MSQTSQLSRHRPAVLAVTTIAAVFGAYYLYRTYSELPSKGQLHRSNAVHRSRSEHRLVLRIELPDATYMLGSLIISKGSRSVLHDLAAGHAPSRRDMTEALGPLADESYEDAMQLAVLGLLQNCTRIQISEMRDRLASTAFAGLPMLLGSPELQGDVRSIERCRDILVSNLPDIESWIVEEAYRVYLDERFSRTVEDQASNATTEDIAETEELDAGDGAPVEPSQGIKGLLYYIAEEESKRKAYEHRGIYCEECGESPIRGIRYHCLNCPDFDVCATCEVTTVHQKTHVLAKIKIPLPVLSQIREQYPIWYPGDPQRLHSPLNGSARKILASQYDFEEPTIDALYDQFTCIANVPWSTDPLNIDAAIDRRAFNQALAPARWEGRHNQNAVYDRMFAFYDTNEDGLVGFGEFLSGISYLRGPKRFASMRRALEGLDMDGDGFVDRSDFLRLFRAKYILQQQLVSDMVDSHEQEQTMAAMDTLRSSQPISSIFNQEEIPQGGSRPQRGKERSRFNDMQPLPGTKTILEDHEPWPRDESPAPNHRASSVPDERERSRHHVSRFEELLYGAAEDVLPITTQHGSTESGAVRPIVPNDVDSTHSAVQPEMPESDAIRDALAQAVEEGLNHMLNPMFEAKERTHQEAIDSREERAQWRTDIDEMLREKRAFEEHLQSAAGVDPLLAVAFESHTVLGHQRKNDRAPKPAFQAQLVPTDTRSLAEREAMIAEQPLEALLQAAGYKAVDEPGEGGRNDALAGELDGSAQSTEEAKSAELASNPNRDDSDPTMPQNKPSKLLHGSQPSEGSAIASPERADVGRAEPTPPQSPNKAPSQRRLEELAALDEIDRAIEERGGPGRLSLNEIEGMVSADTTRQMRGLVTSWLEWAGF
ncbi:hypothetical protein LTR91_014050 [Friedmanniomyces endolithicus]|uniref:Uncharacterized protein n=1 Tax=Friedmanniomyces endolithicus TaxID=329885 RepID=A0AAN6QNW7_9PEZI|nr:hypothetical protein LTR59_011660 [Friedmanniomyces endolithicus]KAK0791146.1 hypothetical protein LTR38_010339 [Friedmanniomyces endolithicus]KAK0803265.1 hypothetical protein LTR75_008021 [Friedmanniomyces endolithicus]KAK0860270.1 hypothetical protein LTS02_008596 [Friedmanniomyces endolithicus]KAK0875426.1 hypothetical protein LTR87_010732 [Friedmanniomyces endolithicus]